MSINVSKICIYNIERSNNPPHPQTTINYTILYPQFKKGNSIIFGSPKSIGDIGERTQHNLIFKHGYMRLRVEYISQR